MKYRLPRYRAAVGACVLILAGLSPVAAQFPPVPGQANSGGAQPQNPFPPAPGQTMAPGGFSAPVQGGFSAPPPSGGFGGGAAPGPSEAQKVCLTFPAIREDVEKGAASIKAAGERKAAREEVCPLFKSFAGKEARMIKFLETNRVLCGVPAQIIPQLKTNHARTIQIRNNVCNAGPSGAPAGPSLSDALGGPIIADDTTAKLPGRGTFDTLTGNALQR